MYYKIEKKESKVYKELVKLRKEEKEFEKLNCKLIVEKTGSNYKSFLGHKGQQNFSRLTQYNGFEFEEPKKLNQKAWKKHKEHPQIFVPNKRTKEGKEMDSFLQHGLKTSFFRKPLDILGVDANGSFSLPFIELVKDVIVMYLDDSFEFENKDVIEITKKEFENILN